MYFHRVFVLDDASNFDGELNGIFSRVDKLTVHERLADFKYEALEGSCNRLREKARQYTGEVIQRSGDDQYTVSQLHEEAMCRAYVDRLSFDPNV